MTPGFRLLTANLLHERCDVVAFEALITRSAPDVVVTQELSHDAAAMLESKFPSHGFFPAVDFTGRGIFTRFEGEFGDIDMPRRMATWARVAVGGREIWLAGVHLLNPISFPWWAAARARRRQLDALFEWMDPIEGPLIVAGDFNASPVWPAYKEVAERLRDVVADHSESRGERAEPTWAWRPGWPRLLRIDHVFARGLAAVDVSVAPVAGSDHFAVIADLEFIDQSAPRSSASTGDAAAVN